MKTSRKCIPYEILLGHVFINAGMYDLEKQQNKLVSNINPQMPHGLSLGLDEKELPGFHMVFLQVSKWLVSNTV